MQLFSDEHVTSDHVSSDHVVQHVIDVKPAECKEEIVTPPLDFSFDLSCFDSV